ncbi:MAG: guanylate kinase [Proteobacteria bacterium]|nr:guanylate kinase [Pseudomonadota bacterium]
MSMIGTLFIISAPSGGGKTSLVNAIIKRLPGLVVSVSYTTRKPRVGEIEGKDYFFIDEQQFQAFKQDNVFLESANVFNNLYGTSKTWVQEKLQAGMDVILEIDWQGALHVKQQMNALSIFLLPPSKEILFERLSGRKQDSADVISKRMAKASQEISHYEEYDYLVVNDNFDEACEVVMAIIRANRARTLIQKHQHASLLSSFGISSSHE